MSDNRVWQKTVALMFITAVAAILFNARLAEAQTAGTNSLGSRRPSCAEERGREVTIFWAHGAPLPARWNLIQR